MYDVKIGVISTYPELSSLILQLAGNMNLSLELKEGILDEGVSYAYQFERNGLDVIISRGVTGRMIKKLVPLPVVLININSFDILQALYKAKGMGRRVAYLGHRLQDFTPEFESITEMLGMNVGCYPYKSTYEMREQAEKIIRDKSTDVVVSTGLCVYEMARKSGVNGVLVQSGYDAINGSIKRALELVQNIRADQARSQRFRSVLELTNDGILILDEKKKVSFMNPSAEKLLGVEAGQVVGRGVEELHESHLLGPLFNNSGQMSEVCEEVRQKQLWVNSMPINIKNKDQGLVITFQSADSIQVMEHNLRRQLFKKGLVARHTFSDLIGKSSLLKETVKRAKKFAAASATVLIGGESGTGKELFAQSIHNESGRSKYPFVAVNCAAIPENLLESELFGYEEGAFTGAKKGGKSGLFEMAHGGTIFLAFSSYLPAMAEGKVVAKIGEAEYFKEPVKKVRTLAYTTTAAYVLLVAADSPYKTVADLKDKPVRYITYPVGFTARYVPEKILEAHGITYKSIEAAKGKVDVVGKYQEACDILSKGQADVIAYTMAVNAQSAALSELESQKEFRILKLDEGLVPKITNEVPLVVSTIPKDLHKSIKEDTKVLSDISTWVVSADMPDETVRKILDALLKNMDTMAQVGNSEFKGFTAKDLAKLYGKGRQIPLHPAAEKYFKEKGAI
ncbi:MAG: TAXI family TRAP transporter solute-binding subunit [Bacillota bacterium]